MMYKKFILKVVLWMLAIGVVLCLGALAGGINYPDNCSSVIRIVGPSDSQIEPLQPIILPQDRELVAKKAVMLTALFLIVGMLVAFLGGTGLGWGQMIVALNVVIWVAVLVLPFANCWLGGFLARLFSYI